MSSPDSDASSYSEAYKTSKRGHVPILVKFAIGGLAGSTGQIVTHPLDVMKIHMHYTHARFFATVRDTFRSAGIRGFYVGLTAALLRQITYSTTRLGIYSTTLDFFKARFGHSNYPTLVAVGMISGILGSLVGTPADLVMVRMISDPKNPAKVRRSYGNALAGLSSISRDEGVLTLWRGAFPTMARAALVNGAQLATYSRTKVHLKDTDLFAEGMILQFCASMISSVVTCLASMPMDTAKTEIQNWYSSKRPPGLVQILLKIARKEGFFSLWRGLLPYYLRAGPNTVIMMITMDQLSDLYANALAPIKN